MEGFFLISKLPQDWISCHSFSSLKKRRTNYSLDSVLFGIELVEKVFVHSLSLGWVQHVEGDSERGTDYFGSDETFENKKDYNDENEQNFVDNWSPVFRGVPIKEIGLHPSGVLRILNKPAQSPSSVSPHQNIQICEFKWSTSPHRQNDGLPPGKILVFPYP